MFALALIVALNTLSSPPTAVCAAGPADSVRVPILVYHNIAPMEARRSKDEFFVPPEVFAEQMQYLKDHSIAVVSLTALVDALQNHCSLPERAVVITFDDGRENQFENAFPVLKRLGFTATFFPFTHAMDANPRYLTWAQLKALQDAGMTIGSHTYLHPRVDKIRDAKLMHTEIAGSRETLQKKLGSEIAFFAYPFGAMSAAGDSAVRAAGYRAARAFSGGPWNSSRDIYHLHAIPTTENMERFKHTVDPTTMTATHTAHAPAKGPNPHRPVSTRRSN